MKMLAGRWKLANVDDSNESAIDGEENVGVCNRVYKIKSRSE